MSIEKSTRPERISEKLNTGNRSETSARPQQWQKDLHGWNDLPPNKSLDAKPLQAETPPSRQKQFEQDQSQQRSDFLQKPKPDPLQLFARFIEAYQTPLDKGRGPTLSLEDYFQLESIFSKDAHRLETEMTSLLQVVDTLKKGLEVESFQKTNTVEKIEKQLEKAEWQYQQTRLRYERNEALSKIMSEIVATHSESDQRMQRERKDPKAEEYFSVLSARLTTCHNLIIEVLTSVTTRPNTGEHAGLYGGVRKRKAEYPLLLHIPDGTPDGMRYELKPDVTAEQSANDINTSLRRSKEDPIITKTQIEDIWAGNITSTRKGVQLVKEGLDPAHETKLQDQQKKKKQYKQKYRKEHKEEKKQCDQEYRKKHKERIKQYAQEYYKEKRKEKKQYAQEYRKEHKERIKQYGQEYYKEKRKEKKQYAQEYRKKHKERIKQYKQEYREANKDIISIKRSINYTMKKMLELLIKNGELQDDKQKSKNEQKIDRYCAKLNNLNNKLKALKEAKNKEKQAETSSPETVGSNGETDQAGLSSHESEPSRQAMEEPDVEQGVLSVPRDLPDFLVQIGTHEDLREELEEIQRDLQKFIEGQQQERSELGAGEDLVSRPGDRSKRETGETSEHEPVQRRADDENVWAHPDIAALMKEYLDMEQVEQDLIASDESDGSEKSDGGRKDKGKNRAQDGTNQANILQEKISSLAEFYVENEQSIHSDTRTAINFQDKQGQAEITDQELWPAVTQIKAERMNKRQMKIEVWAQLYNESKKIFEDDPDSLQAFQMILKKEGIEMNEIQRYLQGQEGSGSRTG